MVDKPKFCRDCFYARPEEHSTWNLRCHNPYIVAKDEWALADAKNAGTSCRTERERTWANFPKCGMKGKLFEQASFSTRP